MPTDNARSAGDSGSPNGTRGDRDDFFCHKYQVWYRVQDCVFRGRNRTFSGCVNCFQGHLNIRILEKGLKPPIFLGRHTPDEPAAGSPAQETPGSLLPFATPRSRDESHRTKA